MEHTIYDKRNYPIVDVQQGYGEWVKTYEQIVEDEMDVALLNRLESVDWSGASQILDLACGTGRIGTWLKARTSAPIDGIDLTPEMLNVARGKNLYRHLHIGDIIRTGLSAGQYDLCTQSLADEHLADIEPLYAEVARITQSGGKFVMVGFHPYFLMMGIPTHFDNAEGQPITIRSYVHLFSDHIRSAHKHGWTLVEMHEGLIDEAWLKKKAKWEKYYGIPISFIFVWEKQ